MSIIDDDFLHADTVKDPLRQAVEKALCQLFRRETDPFDGTQYRISLPILRHHEMTEQVYHHERELVGGDLCLSWLDPTGPMSKNAYLFACWCDEYVRVFQRLDMQVGDVDAYIRREMKILASLHFAARPVIPSPDELRRYAVRLAVDARQPMDESFQQYKCGWGTRWQLKYVQMAAQKNHPILLFTSDDHAKHSPDLVKYSPLVPDLFHYVFKTPPDAMGLVGWIESVLGRQPRRQDTLEYLEVRQVDYEIDGDRVRLWIGDVVVTGIGGKNEQALLRYFCQHPASELSGPELKKQLGAKAITNPSLAAKGIQDALGSARPAAAGWFVTKPFRWAEGILVHPRSTSPP